MIALSAAVCAAAATWLSEAKLAFAAPGGNRIALLPLGPAVVASILLVAAGTALLVWWRRTSAPLLLLVLIALPWLPANRPAAFLLWTGPLTMAVWIGVLLALAAAKPLASALATRISVGPVRAAAVFASVIYLCAAWQVSPSLPGGDEPHYLVITQSLLYDRDLQIENNHRQGDYRAYFAGDLKPDFLRRGRNGRIYSIHAPGVSAVVLPAFAIAGYRGVVVFLILLASIAAALAWHLAFRVTGRTDAAWFGWAAVVLTPTMMLNAFTVYPDGVAALIVLSGVWALVRARDEHVSGAESVRPWFWYGAALAVLPWLHTRFALLAGGLGALVLVRLARTKNPVAKACAFLAVPSLSAVAWIGFFLVVYGVPDPAIPYRGSDLGSPNYIAGGLAGLLFDQQYGLLVHAPVMVAALAGLVVLARTGGEFRWLSVELVFISIPYLLTVTHFAMWWGGFSAPARFVLPIVPALAIPAACAWAAAARRGSRAVLSVALAATGFISGVLVLVSGGRLAYHDRDVYAAWLQWLARVADLQRALPSFFAHQRVSGRNRTLDGAFYAEIAVWLLVLTAGWLIVRALDRHRALRTRARLATATAAVFAVAAMVGATIVWRIERVDGLTPVVAQLDLLRAAGGGRFTSFNLSRWSRVAGSTLPSQLVIETVSSRSPAPAGRDDRPIFALPAIPAGEYRLDIRQDGPTGGWLMVGVGRDQFSIVTQRAEAFASDVPLKFPVDVRAIVVRGDEDARRSPSRLRLRPISLLVAGAKASPERALHAVRYGASTFFFMDDRSFPEPHGFWLGGSRASSIVMQPDTPRATARLLVRNAPVPNELDVQAGSWKAVLTLAPGEERPIDVPVDAPRGATLIAFRVASGFRPSAVDRQSRDERFLGVWVKPE